jgi:hypothetical protein
MRHANLVGLASILGVVAAAACSSTATNIPPATGGSTSASTTSNSGTGGTGTGTGGSTTGTGGGGPAGPGAALKCDSSGTNAFETYGASAFVAVNQSIFANTMAEVTANGSTNIGSSFTKVGSGNPPSTADDAATFEGKLAAFLVWVYGGPNSITYTDGKVYTGNNQDMVAAHTGLGITSSQYTYFVTNIAVPALTSNGVKHGAGGAADPNDVTSCFAPPLLDPTFEASIVGH